MVAAAAPALRPLQQLIPDNSHCASQVIEHQDIAAKKLWTAHALDIGVEAQKVNRTLHRHRRQKPALQAQRPDG